MKTRVIVLGVNRYSFEDDNRKTVEGAKVHYVEAISTQEENVHGHIPQVAVMDYSVFDKLPHVPAYYDAEMSISLTGRKPTLKIRGFDFVAKLDMLEVAPDGKAVAKAF